MTRPPELLFVQLNRVIFNKQTGMPVKINDEFTFEKEIYLDRFTMASREEALKVNQRVADLKAEVYSLSIAIIKGFK